MKRFHEHRGQLYRIDYDRARGGFIAVAADAPLESAQPPRKRAKLMTSSTGIDKHPSKRGKKS